MATPTKIIAARTIARDFVSLGLAALAAAFLAIMLASQANAQKGPVEPANLIEDAIDFCAMMSGDIVSAEDALIAEGWSLDYSEANGPFVWEIGASKIYADGSDAYLFALIELYPGSQITYCTFDVNFVSGMVDLATVADIYDVVGTVEYDGDTAYGAWEQINAEISYFVLADAGPGYLFVQLTAVEIGGAAATAAK